MPEKIAILWKKNPIILLYFVAVLNYSYEYGIARLIQVQRIVDYQICQ